MPSILIQPDNRLLGSVNDLSLYGAQPVPGMSIGRPAEAQSDPKNPSPSDSPSTVEAATGEAPLPVGDEQAATPVPAEPASSAALLNAFEPGHFVAAPAANDVAYSPGATAPSTLLFAASDTVSPQPATLTSAAEPALTAPVLQQADGVSEVLGRVAGDTPIPSAVADTFGHATDLLDGIAGINPAAGIETIVDLMKTADIFELRTMTGDVIDHGLAPIVDILASDITDDGSLLGDIGTHHDEGLLGGIDTHHGLPGLG